MLLFYKMLSFHNIYIYKSFNGLFKTPSMLVKNVDTCT